MYFPDKNFDFSMPKPSPDKKKRAHERNFAEFYPTSEVHYSKFIVTFTNIDGLPLTVHLGPFLDTIFTMRLRTGTSLILEIDRD